MDESEITSGWGWTAAIVTGLAIMVICRFLWPDGGKSIGLVVLPAVAVGIGVSRMLKGKQATSQPNDGGARPDAPDPVHRNADNRPRPAGTTETGHVLPKAAAGDPIQFACTSCGATFRVRATYAGRTATCKKCGARVSIPAVSPIDDARPAPPPPPPPRGKNAIPPPPPSLRSENSDRSATDQVE